MKMLTFSAKTSVIFGEGAATEIPSIMGKADARSAWVISSENLASCGLLDVVEKSLESSGARIEFHLVADREPSFETLQKAFEHASHKKCDLVIGLGGGSCIDTAKLIALGLGQSEGVAGLLKGKNIEGAGAHNIMIPTTAGTGAEVTPNAVFVDESEANKKGIVSEYLIPMAAVVDPTLMVSMPPELTASTGIDALSHSLESFVSRKANAFSDLFAKESVKLAFENLDQACAHGEDVKARSGMALASLYGGFALTHSGTCGAHALAYPLGGRFKVPHGIAVAVLIRPVMDFIRPAIQTRLAELATYLGFSGPLERLPDIFMNELENLLSRIGIPRDGHSWGVLEENIEWLTATASKVRRLLDNSPRELTFDDIRAIYGKIV
jgi:alcohol dehydrogenase